MPFVNIGVFGKFFRMASKVVMKKIKRNADQADRTIADLKNEINIVRSQNNNLSVQQFYTENLRLAQAIIDAKKKLIQLEGNKGVVHIPPPEQLEKPILPKHAAESQQSIHMPEPKPSKKVKKPKEIKEIPSTVEPPVDIGRLDLRIGIIQAVQKHPLADSLYVLKINCGEENARTVCSGLVKHVSLEALQNRIVLMLCNLKPVKMRGVISEAMIMCASSPVTVEVLSPPNECIPGELVHCDGFVRNPDAVMNPKKKIFETVAPDLSTNDLLEACYKGVPLKVPGKGSIVATTLKNCPVK